MSPRSKKNADTITGEVVGSRDWGLHIVSTIAPPHVVDSPSIEVNPPKRGAKSDRVDAGQLLRMLV